MYQCTKCNKWIELEQGISCGAMNWNFLCSDCYKISLQEKEIIKKEREEGKRWEDCVLCNLTCAFCNKESADYAFSYERVFLCSGCWGRMPNDRCDDFLCRYIDGRNNTGFKCKHTLEEIKVREEAEQQKTLIEIPNLNK